MKNAVLAVLSFVVLAGIFGAVPVSSLRAAPTGSTPQFENEDVKVWKAAGGHGAASAQGAQGAPADMPQAVFRNYQELKWGRIFPDLGENSPEICILSVDPKTQATKLMIRTPRGIHVRKHWHTANETHTVILGIQTYACEGKRSEQGPGSFNFMPAQMVHEAWFPAGSLVFITVDGAWDVNWVDGPPTAADLTK